jgi:hypothetical protein
MQNKFAESLAEVRLGHELGSKRPTWRYPSARWVTDAEGLVALSERLPDVLAGRSEPASVSERLWFALMAHDKKRYNAAVRLSTDAFKADPKLADNFQGAHRYHAAGAAVLAASGLCDDDPKPDEAARKTLRAQALNWLKSDLAAWSKAF